MGRLIGHHGFRRGDGDDLEQELALHWWLRRGRFDPSRSSLATFSEWVLTCKRLDLIRRAHSARRNRHNERHIEGVADSALVADVHESKWDLALDVRGAIESLGPPDRRVAVLLMSVGEAEVVRLTGLSRQQVRSAKRRINRHLRERGLP